MDATVVVGLLGRCKVVRVGRDGWVIVHKAILAY